MADYPKVTISDLVLLRASPKAYLVRNADDVEAWIPISQVDSIDLGEKLEDDNNNGRDVTEITALVIPEWLAKDKDIY